MTQRTDRFLLPPPDGLIQNYPCEDMTLPDMPSSSTHERSEIIWDEARASSAIEGLSDAASIERCSDSITLGLDSRLPVGENLLLAMHRVLMRPEPHASPGAYRRVNVVVGLHRPPDYTEVPRLMAQFNHFISNQTINPTFRAAYGHIWFETIHPFTDGNGRTGRALVNAILRRPWSAALLARHQEYYLMLQTATAEDWIDWTVRTLREAEATYSLDSRN